VLTALIAHLSSVFLPSKFTPSSFIPNSLRLPPFELHSVSMNTAKTQCPGCKRIFSHSGYSQHVSKTQRAGCRAVHALGPSHFQTGPAAAFQPLVNMGLSQVSPDTPVTAAHSPADHGMQHMPMFGYFAASSQAWMNGTVYILVP
jgi:hypothetical protein